MSFETRSQQIQQAFSDNFSACPVAWPNESFVTPSQTAWARFNVMDNVSAYDGIGTGAPIRRDGMVIVQVFTPADTGTAESEQIADSIKSALEGLVSNAIHFGAANRRPIGNYDGWYQVNVTIPYFYHD